MKKVYLVICVSAETGVCSIDHFFNTNDAVSFMKTDSEAVFSDEESENNNPEIFDDGKNTIQVVSGEYSWIWSLHELEIEDNFEKENENEKD